jgi:hypothetical protein
MLRIEKDLAAAINLLAQDDLTVLSYEDFQCAECGAGWHSAHEHECEYARLLRTYWHMIDQSRRDSDWWAELKQRIFRGREVNKCI